MGKIIQFRKPVFKMYNTGFEIPVKRDNPPPRPR
jgi:hypothetical protein